MVTSANIIIAQSVNNINITESNHREDHVISFTTSSKHSLNQKPLITMQAAGSTFEISADDLWQVLFMCTNIARSTTQLQFEPV